MQLTRVDLKTNLLLNTWTRDFDGPITCTRFFRLKDADAKLPTFMKNEVRVRKICRIYPTPDL